MGLSIQLRDTGYTDTLLHYFYFVPVFPPRHQVVATTGFSSLLSHRRSTPASLFHSGSVEQELKKSQILTLYIYFIYYLFRDKEFSGTDTVKQYHQVRLFMSWDLTKDEN